MDRGGEGEKIRRGGVRERGRQRKRREKNGKGEGREERRGERREGPMTALIKSHRPHLLPASFCRLGLNRCIWDNTDKPQLQPQGLPNSQLPMTTYMKL